jgi:hypothetical protein
MPSRPALATLARAAAFSLWLMCGVAWALPEGEMPDGTNSEAQATELPELPLDEPVVETPLGLAEFGNRALRPESHMVFNAMNFLGVAYRRGGSTELSGFDCSGFTRYIVQTTFGFVLPRRADAQASAPGLRKVKREELQPGDLVFFNTLKRTFSHVGIYMGDGKFIHSPRAGGRVRIEDMGFAYWRKRFTGARRLGALVKAAGEAATPMLPALPQPGP